MSVAARGLAAISLAITVVTGAVLSVELLPLEVTRTARAEFPSDMADLSIALQPGENLRLVAIPKAAAPRYEAQTTSRLQGLPDPLFDDGGFRLSSGCRPWGPPLAALDDCHTSFTVFAPKHLAIHVLTKGKVGRIRIDPGMDVNLYEV